MGAPYGGTSISGYNANPPPDDGSTGANNQVGWNATIKAKIGDPLQTAIVAMDSNLTGAFGKMLSGATAVKTNVSYPMSAADQGRLIVATTSGITITTPDATSVHSPFVFAFSNQSTGTITIAGFGGTQTVDGNTSTTIYPGCGGVVWTDGSNWFTNGLVQGNIRTVNPAFGFDAPVNLQLNASVGSNLLTIAVKANNGADPSSSNPVLIPFRDATIANGDPVWVAVTSALSISTNATGASLGTANSVPFRLWVVAFNNAGTAVLALWQSVTGGSTPTAINPLNEATLQSTTGISAAATSAGVFYTPNGTTLSSKAFRILAFVDYASGLTTAGTYASAPTTVQLFGPGIKKPGDEVQRSFVQTGSTSSTTASYVAASTGAVLSPTSSINLFECFATSGCDTGNSAAARAQAQIQRQIGAGSFNSVTTSNQFTNSTASSGVEAGALTMMALDAPGTSSQLTYKVFIANQGTGGGTCSYGSNGASTPLCVKEIMV